MSLTTFIIIQSSLIIVAALFFGIRNLILKNEKLESENITLKDKLNTISQVIESSSNHLKEIDTSGAFKSDDEIGWFFTQIQEIQTDLNTFIETQNQKLL